MELEALAARCWNATLGTADRQDPKVAAPVSKKMPGPLLPGAVKPCDPLTPV
jgi:hypothetical protein